MTSAASEHEFLRVRTVKDSRTEHKHALRHMRMRKKTYYMLVPHTVSHLLVPDMSWQRHDLIVEAAYH